MKGARLLYGRALDALHHVITTFPADRWDTMTPCTEWTARALTGHVNDGQLQVAGMLTGQLRPPVADADELVRIAGPAPVAAWRAARREIDAALSSVGDGAVVSTPLGDRSVEAVLGDTLAATGMYAPARPVHDDVPPQDRLLALTGRDPVAARRPARSTFR